MLRNTSDVCPVLPTFCRQPRISPLQISSRCSRLWRVDRPVAPTHSQTRRQQRHRRRLSGNLSPYTVNGISCFRPSQSGRLVSTVNFFFRFDASEWDFCGLPAFGFTQQAARKTEILEFLPYHLLLGQVSVFYCYFLSNNRPNIERNVTYNICLCFSVNVLKAVRTS